MEAESFLQFPETTLSRCVSEYMWGSDQDVTRAYMEGELIMGFDGKRILRYIKGEDGHVYKIIQESNISMWNKETIHNIPAENIREISRELCVKF